MNNFEYANATDEQLEQWAFDAYQAEQEFQYEESVCRSYEARGMHNVY